MNLEARVLTPGDADGTLMLLDTPLSLWGGVDLTSSEIIDRTHPQCGARIEGRILAMQTGRGSSSSASALVELARVKHAPAAIILAQHDPILVMGALVADELYGIRIPILIWEQPWTLLRPDQALQIRAQGTRAHILIR